MTLGAAELILPLTIVSIATALTQEALKLQGRGVVTGKWFPGPDWENKVGICDWPALWTISFTVAQRKPQGSLPGC